MIGVLTDGWHTRAGACAAPLADDKEKKPATVITEARGRRNRISILESGFV
jgi:hypothetical protein